MLKLGAYLLCAVMIAPPLCFGEDQPLQVAGEPPVSVRMALQWSPQSQFAGFYLAQAHGYYAEAGADVSFLHANARHSSLEWLQQGKAELATAFLADAMVAAANADEGSEARLVLIGQLVRRSNLMLLGWGDQGIGRLRDLDGRPVSLWPGPFSAAVRALLADRGIEPKFIPQYGTVNLFLHQGVAACSAMEYNEYHRVWQAGVDQDRLKVFLLRDLGFGLPEDGLYARADWLQRHGALVERLWRATMAGWEYARAHPERALDLVLAEAERAQVPTNRPHERWMLKHLLASIFNDSSEESLPPARLSASAYAATAKALIGADLFDKAPPLADFCPGCRARDERSSLSMESHPMAIDNPDVRADETH